MSHHWHLGTAITLILSVTTLNACSLLPNRQTPREAVEYRIDPTITPQSSTSVKDCADLRIDTPTSAPGFGTRSMLYSKAPYQIAAFAYHRWLAPPADMLASPLMEQLRTSNLFTHVISDASPASAPLVLDTRLVTLLQVFRGGQSKVRLVIDATLNDVKTGSTLATRRFYVIVATTAPNPVAGVAATNIAVTRWLGEVDAWLTTQATLGCCECHLIASSPRPNPK